MSTTHKLPGTDVDLPAELVPLLVPIDTVREDPSNPRIAKDVEHLASLMKRFGFTDPIAVNVDGMILAGHRRLDACRSLGATHIPRVVVHHDAVTGMAFNLAHNRSNEVVAEWDMDALPKLLGRLRDEDMAEGLGWAGDELSDLLAKLEPPQGKDDGEDEEGEDEIPLPPAEPITAFGEVISLGRHTLHCADCMDVLRSLPDNSVDSIVTDPPYGLSPDGRARTWDEIDALRREGKGPKSGFMGKEWDAGVPGITWARECLRVLKPGGHMIAFASSRTIHRLTCAVEDAGFEIRDGIDWLYWQGFPKSHDVSKAIDDAAGAVRDVVGRRHRPLMNSSMYAADAGCGFQEDVTAPATPEAIAWDGWGTALKPAKEPAVLARKPLSESTVAANVLRWGTGALNVDACRMAAGDPAWPGPNEESWSFKHTGRQDGTGHTLSTAPRHGVQASESRFPANIYYCPKPSGGERNDGCEGLAERESGVGALRDGGRGKTATNYHPTVKPKKLWRWLMRLVTPPGGRCFESFAGSGTAFVAAEGLDIEVIGAEMSPGYCDIIRARAGFPAGAVDSDG